MNKIKPEFGNLHHIALLDQERKEKEKAEKYREKIENSKEVGTQSLEGCGYCGQLLDHLEYFIRLDDQIYRFCSECDSLVDSRRNPKKK